MIPDWDNELSQVELVHLCKTNYRNSCSSFPIGPIKKLCGTNQTYLKLCPPPLWSFCFVGSINIRPSLMATRSEKTQLSTRMMPYFRHEYFVHNMYFHFEKRWKVLLTQKFISCKVASNPLCRIFGIIVIGTISFLFDWCKIWKC